MDLAYWGFRHWPFERSFAADRYFASPLNEEAMSRLLFLIEESRRSGIIVGPHGTGKTYLLKLIGQRAERLGRRVVRCDATGQDFLAHVATACLVNRGHDTLSARTWNGLRARFAAWALIRQPLVLLVDHFDPQEKGCAQTVQRLQQLADTVELRLTVVLALADQTIAEALQESIELRIDLTEWTVQETARFIQAAVEHAGCKRALFTDDAIEQVQKITGGIPAKIVSLGNLCLLAARVQEDAQVTRQTVEAVASELSLRMTSALASQRRPESRVASGKRNDKSFVH